MYLIIEHFVFYGRYSDSRVCMDAHKKKLQYNIFHNAIFPMKLAYALGVTSR